MAQEQCGVSVSDRSQVVEQVEALLQTLGAEGGQDAVANLRQAILHDVEVRVSEKSEVIWKRARAMFEKLETKHCEESTRLASLVVECKARADGLEADNAKLRRQVEELGARLASVNAAFGSATPGFTAPPTSAAIDLDASAVTTHGGLVAMPPGLERPLPFVPPFPDSEGKSSKAPLNLSDSLASPRPAPQPKMPLTLSDTITPPATAAGADPSRGRFVFSFTIRKADGLGLGLNISHGETDDSLLVEGVGPDGAVAAWNRLCANGPSAEKAVRAGDRITSVNGILQDRHRMLDECRERTTVKLVIMRSDAPPVINTLRAEAVAFVPGALVVEAKPTSPASSAPAPEATPEAEQAH